MPIPTVVPKSPSPTLNPRGPINSMPTTQQDWRFPYLTQAFVSQLSPAAINVIRNTTVSNSGWAGTSYNALNRKITILPGDEWAAAHEYTHAILSQTGKNSPSVYSLADARQNARIKENYIGPFQNPLNKLMWAKDALLRTRGGEMAAQVTTMYGGQYQHIPSNLRPAFSSMYNLRGGSFPADPGSPVYQMLPDTWSSMGYVPLNVKRTG